MIDEFSRALEHGATNPNNAQWVLFGIYAVVAIVIGRVLINWVRWLVQ